MTLPAVPVPPDDPPPPALIEPEAVEGAARALRGVIVRTPLVPIPWIEGGEVRLKCENLQVEGAFKVRGAFTMVSRLAEEERRRGLVTYSSGNAARAVAWTARRFGVPAVAVMPTTAPAVKVEGVRRLGAEVIFEGITSLERKARAERVAAERGATIVPPFDHPDVIAGQGTVGLEILEDWPDVDAILVPTGGGGLVAGIAAWVKRASPECAVVAVEPEAADSMRRSHAAGCPVTVEVRPTIADGIATVRPGDLTFAHAHTLVDEFLAVDDDAIARAADLLLETGKLLVEHSGAAPLAAILAGRWPLRGRRVALVLSGGNRPVPTGPAHPAR